MIQCHPPLGCQAKSLLLHRLSTQQSKAVVDPLHAYGCLDTDIGKREHCVHSSQAMPAVRQLLCLLCMLSKSCFPCHACCPAAALPVMPAIQQLLCLPCLLSKSCIACHVRCPTAALPVMPAVHQLLCLLRLLSNSCFACSTVKASSSN